MVQLALSDKEFRRLLDMVYIGNWVLNSVRGSDRFEDYDLVESRVFAECAGRGFNSLFRLRDGKIAPSLQFENGGIHDAIIHYEDAVFFEILAEEFARRDMNFEPITFENFSELTHRIDEYMLEFEENGLQNVFFEK